ncbi:type I restriction endonuclease subunit R [Bdellovibrio bacteriovorus]|uniref:type I restriction endonuclease subunit R n=1 Tax=Bdellovibrio bacteriovorus TaxID=959 RepID=UPI0035A6A1E1
MTPKGFGEGESVELPSIEILRSLGWSHIDCYEETFGAAGDLGRENSGEVVILPRLKDAIKRLNPGLAPEAIELAIEEINRDRSSLSLVNANREVYKLLKDGVPVRFRTADDEDHQELVRIIDWKDSGRNDYLVVSQLWITGPIYRRRPDLIGFVNGIPLVFVEFKASHRRLENAYRDNLRDYKDTIPQIFWFNGFILLSNGLETKVGAITSEWSHFYEWKKINSEGEAGRISLETVLKGVCERSRLLDLIENFILFSDTKGGTVKICGMNHQFLGVNKAIKAVQDIQANQGKLGVFWHTQGSGKSFSMIFFTEKILRRVSGRFTFVIITDRTELDNQIYKTFASTGAVIEEGVQADSAEHLRQLLAEDHRYVFTLIHKFRTEDGQQHPIVSTRDDIIVVADEAHRSQYDTLALNMRNALPNAAFIGFTGTPLIAGEEKTREVFGDYVSVYNFKQSIEDNATVPLYYENRIPELQIINENFGEELETIVEDADLSEEGQHKLEREFAREYHLITREDRLEKIAEDIVNHFMGRGYLGKAMVVAIDRFTAVRMYNKVKAYWAKYIAEIEEKLKRANLAEIEVLQKKLAFMRKVDMAVVISQSQNEVDDFRQRGVDILPHRERFIREDLETTFKDANSDLKLVFVCAMWMTGFDVPSCSTVYIDKPMQNHTLMQTIARANRVYEGKKAGIIVDYIGIFRNLQKALSIYGASSSDGIDESDTPAKSKEELIVELEAAIAEANGMFRDRGLDAPSIATQADKISKLQMIEEATEAFLENEDIKKSYISAASRVTRTFKAVLPDPRANQYAGIRAVHLVVAERLRALTENEDISDVLGEVEDLLDESIAAESYVIRAPIHDESTDHLIDLSNIDFDALAEKFKIGKKRALAERLRGAVANRLNQMARLNRTRMELVEKLERLIEEYNSGAKNVEHFFDELVNLAQTLDDEQKRAAREQLDEESLAIFDLLTRPELKLSDKDKKAVKKVAKELVGKIRASLVIAWKKKQQTRAAVRVTIEKVLDQGLPEVYDRKLFSEKCERIYQHVFDTYGSDGENPYSAA